MAFKADVMTAMKEFRDETRTAAKESAAAAKEDFREFELLVAAIVVVGYLSGAMKGG